MDTPIDIELDTPKKVFTVGEITRNIRFTLEDKFSSVWVEGEISNFIHHGSGHMYFSLKDAEAGLQAVMFRQENARMRFKPENGMRVVCRGRVSVYPARGQYQLVCEAMEPKGVGDLQIAFEQLKKKLAAEGLFDEGRKRPVPHLPRCVGIVTSLTGAVIRDMLHVTARRFPGAHFLIAPAKVQGEGAKEEIVQALRDLDASGLVDVIVLARGGGSLEDLWAFNEEIVARAIAASGTPVVSAIGHEVDYTIADFVADLRAPTPSAAAEVLFPEKAELEGPGRAPARPHAGAGRLDARAHAFGKAHRGALRRTPGRSHGPSGSAGPDGHAAARVQHHVPRRRPQGRPVGQRPEDGRDAFDQIIRWRDH